MPSHAGIHFTKAERFTKSVESCCYTLKELTSAVTDWINEARASPSASGANNDKKCAVLFILDACRDQGAAEFAPEMPNAKVHTESLLSKQEADDSYCERVFMFR